MRAVGRRALENERACGPGSDLRLHTRFLNVDHQLHLQLYLPATPTWRYPRTWAHGPEVDLTLPNMPSKEGSEFSDNTVGVPKEVGSLDRYLLPVLNVRSGGDILAIRGEILAIGKNSIVFLLGFSKRNH